MKKKICVVVALFLSIFSLISCVGRNSVRVYVDEIRDSLRDDYNINIINEYGYSNLWSSNKDYYTDLHDYKNVVDKLGKWMDFLSILYIKTDNGEHKFIYYPDGVAKKSIKENGQTITAKVKDYIYISDFPFTYTYDDIYNQCNKIMDDSTRNELLAVLENGIIKYDTIYPNKTSIFKNFATDETTLINSLLIDKQLVFTGYYNYNVKYYNYCFFFIEEDGTDKLFIYKETSIDSTDNAVIYTSSTTAPAMMTKDIFINHLKTL